MGVVRLRSVFRRRYFRVCRQPFAIATSRLSHERGEEPTPPKATLALQDLGSHTSQREDNVDRRRHCSPRPRPDHAAAQPCSKPTYNRWTLSTRHTGTQARCSAAHTVRARTVVSENGRFRPQVLAGPWRRTMEHTRASTSSIHNNGEVEVAYCINDAELVWSTGARTARATAQRHEVRRVPLVIMGSLLKC